MVSTRKYHGICFCTMVYLLSNQTPGRKHLFPLRMLKAHLLSSQHIEDINYSRDNRDEDVQVTGMALHDHSQQFSEDIQEKQSHA